MRIAVLLLILLTLLGLASCSRPDTNWHSEKMNAIPVQFRGHHTQLLISGLHPHRVAAWLGLHGSWRGAYPIISPLLEMVGNWREFLLSGVSGEELDRIRRHERTGRPLGEDGFVGRLEKLLDRILHRQKPGRRRGPKQK